MTTYNLDRKGYISYKDGGSKYYLRGLSVTYSGVGWAYWALEGITDPLSIFTICEEWPKVCGKYTLYRIGEWSEMHSAAPTHLYVGEDLVLFHLDYEKKSCLLLKANPVEEMTREWLESTMAVPKPVVKQQSPQEWAFKMGTLCSDNVAPNWAAITNHKGYEWVNGYLRGVYCASERLTEYFRLGSYCRQGTPFRLVHSGVGGKLYLSTIPQ